jgi:MYXO-CTERM domain-containing protein
MKLMLRLIWVMIVPAIFCARDVLACSGLVCAGGAFLPVGYGQAPAGVDVIHWTPYQSTSNPPSLHTSPIALNGDDGSLIMARAEMIPNDAKSFLLRLDSGLIEGIEYTVSPSDFCNMPSWPDVHTQPIKVGPPAAPATALGTLSAQAPVVGELGVASSAPCTELVRVSSARVELAWDPSAEPWQHMFLFQTLVDGNPWHPQEAINYDVPAGHSWRGRGRDEIFALCDPTTAPDGTPRLAEGAHSVQIVASLPGSSTVLASNIIEIMLECTERPDAGIAADGGDAATAPDAGDAESSDADAGSESDGSTNVLADGGDAGFVGPPPTTTTIDDDACDCATTSGGGRGLLIAGLAFAVIALRRRRR